MYLTHSPDIEQLSIPSRIRFHPVHSLAPRSRTTSHPKILSEPPLTHKFPTNPPPKTSSHQIPNNAYHRESRHSFRQQRCNRRRPNPALLRFRQQGPWAVRASPSSPKISTHLFSIRNPFRSLPAISWPFAAQTPAEGS